MNEIPRHSVSVAAAIINNHGQALAIQRRDNRHWEPPGGIVEHGETLEQALNREVHEETGLTIDIERLTGIYHNLTRNVIAFVYRCHTTGGELRTTPETHDAEWLTKEEITEYMDEAYAIRILDAFDPTTFPTIRPHNGVNLAPPHSTDINQ